MIPSTPVLIPTLNTKPALKERLETANNRSRRRIRNALCDWKNKGTEDRLHKENQSKRDESETTQRERGNESRKRGKRNKGKEKDEKKK